MTTIKTINFDMDGTFVNLYGVSGWLDDIINERTRPYAVAKPLLNMSAFARQLNRLIANGYTVNIISWTAKNGTNEYNERVAEAKRKWIAKHLPSVGFNHINIVPYGTPKHNIECGILFDDEIENRNMWGQGAYDVRNILEILKTL